MRVQIPATKAAGNALPMARVLHTTKKCNVKLQIFDPVTVYMSQNSSDLNSVDPIGNPQAGLQLTQGIYDFLAISGEIWLACNQQIAVEVQFWPLQ